MSPSRPSPRLIDHDPALLAAAMDELDDAGGGWLNVLPEIPENVPVPPTPGVLAVFSKRGPVVPLGTWVATATSAKGRSVPSEIGIQHGTSNLGAPRLADTPGEVPAGWAVLSDSPRRGLVVRCGPDTPKVEQARWLLDALVELCIPPQTGRFQLFRYDP